jgi:RNA polymerase sporulation-specific sigma factor
MKLVHNVAKKYRHQADGSFSYDDIVSEATIGLIQAFHKYDPSKFEGGAIQFSTYAVPTIIGAIRRFLRDKKGSLKISRELYTLTGHVLKNDLLGAPATEISEKLECSLLEAESVTQYLYHSNVVSMDQHLSPGSGEDSVQSIVDVIKIFPDLTEIHVQDFLGSLNVKERMIVEMRMDGKSQYQIGDVLHLSQVQISRLLVKIGVKLNRYMESKEDESEAIAMIDQTNIGGLVFNKGDVIRPGGNEDDSRIYLTGFSDEIKRAYGIKLTRECVIDGRSKINDQGWNATVSYNQLSGSKIMLQSLSWQDIQPGPDNAKQKLSELNKSEVERPRAESKLVNREVTTEEAAKYGIKNLLEKAEWFTDTSLPSVATIGINKQGISFNAPAMAQIGLTDGGMMEIGFVKDSNQLIMKKSDQGLSLRKMPDRETLLLINKRLVEWLLAKKIKSTRYRIVHDEKHGVWISTLEKVMG